MSDREISSNSGSESSHSEEIDEVFEDRVQVCEYNLDTLVNVLSFFVGVFTNWGSLNMLGVVIGFNYKCLVNKKFYLELLDSLNGAIPSFVLGIFIVNVCIPYFIVSLFIGLSAQKYKFEIKNVYSDFRNNNFNHVTLFLNHNKQLLNRFISEIDTKQD